MSVLVILIAVSLAMSTLFVAACIASIRGGQFDDLESPRWRVLFNDPSRPADAGSISNPRMTQHDTHQV